MIDYSTICLTAQEYKFLERKLADGTITDSERARMEELEPIYMDWIQQEHDNNLMEGENI